jgi:hypothetical protein
VGALTQATVNQFVGHEEPINPGYLQRKYEQGNTTVHSDGRCAAFVTRGGNGQRTSYSSCSIDLITMHEHRKFGYGATVLTQVLRSITDTPGKGKFASGDLLSAGMDRLFKKVCDQLHLEYKVEKVLKKTVKKDLTNDDRTDDKYRIRWP